MKLSKMVEENITSEEVEIIEEKKKCKKQKLLMEEGMKYCAKCGTEYDEALEACPKCEATETFSKCESIDLRIAKKEATLTAGVEDETALTTEITALKARKEAECTEEEAPAEAPVVEAKAEEVVVEEPVSESKEVEEIAIAKVEEVIANITELLNIGQEAQANGKRPLVGYEGAQEQLRKTLLTLDKMKVKVEKKVDESEEVIAEADILVETPTTDEETTEMAYLKSLSGM